MCVSQTLEEQSPRTEYGIDPVTKGAYMKANFPWMKNIYKEIIDGRQAKREMEVYRAESDSCWIVVDSLGSAIDSLNSVMVLKDRQTTLREDIMSNKDIQYSNTLKENKGLKRALAGEKVQKWTFIGTTAVAIILAITLGIR